MYATTLIGKEIWFPHFSLLLSLLFFEDHKNSTSNAVHCKNLFQLNGKHAIFIQTLPIFELIVVVFIFAIWWKLNFIPCLTRLYRALLLHSRRCTNWNHAHRCCYCCCGCCSTAANIIIIYTGTQMPACMSLNLLLLVCAHWNSLACTPLYI